MKINWKVRLKNKSFWLALIPALLDPLYQPADYLLPLLNVFAPFVLLLLFLIILWLHQNKKAQ